MSADDVRGWGLERSVTEDTVALAAVDVVALTMDDMRAEFYRVKASRGWPESAQPLWHIGWTYTEPLDE